MRALIYYQVRRAVIAPIFLCVLAITLSIDTPWALIAIPFIGIGWLSAAPNFNFADGLIAMIFSVMGLITSSVRGDIGIPIMLGTFSGWLLCSLEMALRKVPVYEDDEG